MAATISSCFLPESLSAPLMNVAKVNVPAERLSTVSNLLDQGLYDDCVDKSSALIEQPSTDNDTRGYALCLRGMARSLLNQPVKAIRDIDSGMELNPYVEGKDDLYGVQATCLFKLGRCRDALNKIGKSLAVEPNSMAYRLRGLVYLHLDNYKLALNDFDEALKFGDCSADLIELRETTAAKLGAKRIHATCLRRLTDYRKCAIKNTVQKSTTYVCQDDYLRKP